MGNINQKEPIKKKEFSKRKKPIVVTTEGEFPVDLFIESMVRLSGVCISDTRK